jgi:hypothetical protein
MEKDFEKTEMTTLVSCTNRLTQEGYTENFVPKKEGIEAPSTGKLYVPGECRIVSFYRFEGESDPADNCVLYAVETDDGTKGLLVDAYGGPYVNHKIGKFIKEVQDIEKRAHTDVGPHCKTETEPAPEERIETNKKKQNSNL